MNLFMLTSNAAVNLNKEQTYTLDGNNISFTLSPIWKENFDTEHDLSLSKLESNLQISAYKKSYVECTAEELLKENIKKELKDVDSKTLTKKYDVNKTRNRTIYARLYTTVKNNIETQYYFSVMEFEESDTFVFVVYNARGSHMKYSIDDIQRLLLKMEWKGPKTSLVYN